MIWTVKIFVLISEVSLNVLKDGTQLDKVHMGQSKMRLGFNTIEAVRG